MAEFTQNSQLLDSRAQKLNFGTMLELLEIDCSPLGGTVHRICNSRSEVGVTYFLGVPFAAVPFESEGWQWDGTGNAPRPTVTVADVDGLLLYESFLHQDIVGMRVRRWLTTAELVGSDTYRGPEIWVILKKLEADGSSIKFELGTYLDRETVQLPRRSMQRDEFPALGRSRTR